MSTKIKNERNYERQEKLKLSIPEGVVIVGCGGTGTWTALSLLLVGVRNFVLFDGDDIANHNLNRLPYSPEDVGKSKVHCLAELMRKLEPNINVVQSWTMADPTEMKTEDPEWNPDQTMASMLQPLNSISEPPVLIDCTDDIKTQQWLSKLCKDHKRRYLRVGCSASEVYVGGKVPSGSFAKDLAQGYATPSWIAPPMIAGAIATQILCGGPEIKITGIVNK